LHRGRNEIHFIFPRRSPRSGPELEELKDGVAVAISIDIGRKDTGRKILTLSSERSSFEGPLLFPEKKRSTGSFSRKSVKNS
jgi:hypothetical protein